LNKSMDLSNQNKNQFFLKSSPNNYRYKLSNTKKFSILSLALILGALNAESKFEPIKLTNEKISLTDEIVRKISNEHFYQKKNLEELDKQFVSKLLERLDPNKIYFTKTEVSNFEAQNSIDKRFDLSIGYQIINNYFLKLEMATKYQIFLIENTDIDFSIDDHIDVYPDDNEWAEDISQLHERWNAIAKNDLLSLMLSKENVDHEENLVKRYKRRLRSISQRNEEDIYSIAINSITNLFDPHSSYLSPKSAEDFDMQMSLKLEGIGALLGTEDDYPQIVKLIKGGPAEKSGKIEQEDLIISVRQIDEEEPVDVIGWRIDEVVQLIRGPSGTKLELELAPKDLLGGEHKFVILEREEVKLEEQAAQSKIISTPINDKEIKLGIINLPAFYIDFNGWRNRDPDFRSSSKDIEKILAEFNEQNVDALLLDLRGNSGGSLYEANRLTGLFVAAGATVQVKESNGYVRPWGDGRAIQAWEKPLAVLVDRYSASASEILAGAIQDYERGIIIGDQTYGKGTVQKLDSLSAGQIKITESKFYRVSGESTQRKGIVPDILLPTYTNRDDFGEEALETALPWDVIKPIRHKKYGIDNNAIEAIRISVNHRAQEDPNLTYISSFRKTLEDERDIKFLSLNIEQRKKEKETREARYLGLENDRRESLKLETFDSYQDLLDYRKALDEVIDVQNDLLLNEASRITTEYAIQLQNTKSIYG
ncbi:MAG: carboxy terminal-processing peptidase, partial [Gammaproteobacteria bacterium]